MIFEALFGMGRKKAGYTLEELTPETLCSVFQAAYLDVRPVEGDGGEVVVECEDANVVVRPRPDVEAVALFALFPLPTDDRVAALEMCNKVNTTFPLVRAGVMGPRGEGEEQVLVMSHDHAIGDKVITGRELVCVLRSFVRMLLVWQVQLAGRDGG